MPPDCGRAWVDAGVYEDEAYIKLIVPLPGDWRDRESSGDLTRSALGTRDAVVTFLKRMPEFSRSEVTRTGCLGIRDGGRVRGEYCLTAEDVRRARKFPDAACRCAWPIEYWDADRDVSLEYLPDGDYWKRTGAALRHIAS